MPWPFKTSYPNSHRELCFRKRRCNPQQNDTRNGTHSHKKSRKHALVQRATPQSNTTVQETEQTQTLAFIELKPLGFAALNENDMPATRAFERLGDRSNGCAKRLLLKRPHHLSAREPMENIHTIHKRHQTISARLTTGKNPPASRPGPCIIAKIRTIPGCLQLLRSSTDSKANNARVSNLISFL
jgi:hypothetical protein